ncbi:MAG TPA: SGNH/GDSL hydrolase family protein [Candidatus Acidoferrales bacterium]|nr:SGNH/GDSL hydrolase family protein [Candidatus Acidoferrales bacterium]
MIAGLSFTINVLKIPHTIPHLIRPSFDISLPKPANTGVITINKIGKIPATVITAGDSLARGKGSHITNGVLANIGYYLVRRANNTTPGIARYHVIPSLSVDGSSVEQLTKRLKAQNKTLAKIPNLVLLLSFTNRDMKHFVMDAEKVHSTNQLGEFFQLANILHHDSKLYQHSLSSLTQTLADIHSNRVKILGKKLAVMQVGILGLPNESYAPKVQAVLHKYHVTYGEISYVINLFNTDDQKAVVSARSYHSGVTYSFVNLDKLQVTEKTALADLSPDKFHPNSLGYQSLTNYIAQNVLVHQNQKFTVLAKN